MALGFFALRTLIDATSMLTESLVMNLGGLLVSPLIVWASARWALPGEETTQPTQSKRFARILLLIVAALAAALSIYLLGNLMIDVGRYLQENLEILGFMGTFLVGMGDIIVVTTPAFAALVGGAAIASTLGRFGQALTERYSPRLVKILNLVLMGMALALVFALIGAAINWLYEIDNPALTFWLPVIAGLLLGMTQAARAAPKESIPIGMTIYYTSRTILNGVRSVEPIIMAIVAVIWVGIGPFAGVIALGLHTVASLGKLYSEQVESISLGPLEAIRATGATRLQTIIYAVAPQIVPPYIAFTMYRWDINVRMSTIIGFVGGGGIGFLLSQNINLLNYRAAAVQMLAIAIVVAIMDYTSSFLRQKVT
jgi:phosphonate ABC transporter permease subunit PhnE